MLSIILELLKFIALGIGSASGLVGTLTETKDKSTGKLSRGGKAIIALIVASGVVAASTLSIEVYLKRRADQADREQRLQEFEALYSLTHPLGNLKIQVNVTYPIAKGIGGLDASWLARVRSSTSKSFAVLNDANDPLRPLGDSNDEATEFGLLVEPKFDVTLNRVPTQTGSDGVHLLNHGAGLMFRAAAPRSLLYLHFSEMKIDNQIYAETTRLIDDGSISSWRDLYGAEVIIHLPQTAPEGANITRFVMTFSTGAQFGSQIIEVPLTKAERRTDPFNEPFSNITYVHVLSKNELGTMPALLHRTIE